MLCAAMTVVWFLPSLRVDAATAADEFQIPSRLNQGEHTDLDRTAEEALLHDPATAESVTAGAMEQIDELGRTSQVIDPEAAQFDSWQPLTDKLVDNLDRPPWCPIRWSPETWFQDLGFRHSSTHGRNVGQGKPLTHSSWSNRPYHVDWFLGQLLGDELIGNRVNMKNGIIGGMRVGWDFDHYWGVEWKAGWATPDVTYSTPLSEPNTSNYFLSSIDLIYYPWGDSRIRPYLLLGMGMSRVKFRDENSVNQSATLLTVPFGVGLQFPQWHWLVWRLEILDNAAFGSDYVSGMGNFTFTLGMEWRIGARPPSYWPWRSSRTVW